MTYKTSWDLRFLYSNLDDEKIKQDDTVAQKEISDFVKKRSENAWYLSSASLLKEALDDYSTIMSHYYYWTKSSVYFWLQSVLQQDEKLKALSNKSDEFSKNLMISLQFFQLSLGQISQEKQTEFLHDISLAQYKQFLRRIFDTAKFDLTQEQEKIFTMMTKTSYQNWTKMLDDFFSLEYADVVGDDGAMHKKTFEEVMMLISHTNKTVRDSAAVALNWMFQKHLQVWEVELNTVLEYKKLSDQLRGYSRPDESRLVSDDVPVHVLDSLLESFAKNNDIAQDFYTLKAKLLWLDKLQYHERNVPFVWNVEEWIYIFEQAVEIVGDVMKKLDPEFAQIFQDLLDTWLIDVYPKEGKQWWAFNAGLWKNVGNVVMLNYTNKFNDVVTFAHEMWHAINSQLIAQKQKWLYYGYGMFTAEVASTFMEDFVFDALLQTATDEQKLTIMMNKLNGSISTLHRQISCYTFEQELHQQFREQWYLSHETIGSIFQKHMKNYMWPSVEQSEWSQNWWLYRSHIREFFYVYSYAWGLLIAKALQQKVRENPAYIQVVKNDFLSVWRSVSPAEMFMKMWIDIADKKFWDDGLGVLREQLEETKELARKLGYV